MANIILNGKTVVTQTGNDEPLIGGNVLMHNDVLANATFPAGHVIQVLSGSYDTLTTIGTTYTKIIELSGQAKGNNSKFIAFWTLVAGGSSDSHGYYLRINLNSGTSSTNNTSDVMQVLQSTNGITEYRTWWEDVPINYENAYSGGYGIHTINGSVEKTTTFSKGDNFSCGFWVSGESTLYINRSENRASHEGGISRLVLYEVAT